MSLIVWRLCWGVLTLFLITAAMAALGLYVLHALGRCGCRR